VELNVLVAAYSFFSPKENANCWNPVVRTQTFKRQALQRLPFVLCGGGFLGVSLQFLGYELAYQSPILLAQLLPVRL
jgi:hypothetical protein